MKTKGFINHKNDVSNKKPRVLKWTSTNRAEKKNAKT